MWLCSPARSGAVRGFTFVETVVVVAIILIIVGLVLPAASELWNERRSAEAENVIQGLLMSERARAMQAGGVEGGILAFVDAEGNITLPLVGVVRAAGQTPRDSARS